MDHLLLLYGLRRRARPVRAAGFLVLALAAAKVAIFDLSTLDAFYPVGSAFLLAVASLALAYLYHRKLRDASDPQ